MTQKQRDRGMPLILESPHPHLSRRIESGAGSQGGEGSSEGDFLGNADNGSQQLKSGPIAPCTPDSRWLEGVCAGRRAYGQRSALGQSATVNS